MISNTPFLLLASNSGLQREPQYEPPIALLGVEGGQRILQRLVDEVPRVLKLGAGCWVTSDSIRVPPSGAVLTDQIGARRSSFPISQESTRSLRFNGPEYRLHGSLVQSSAISRAD